MCAQERALRAGTVRVQLTLEVRGHGSNALRVHALAIVPHDQEGAAFRVSHLEEGADLAPISGGVAECRLDGVVHELAERL